MKLLLSFTFILIGFIYFIENFFDEFQSLKKNLQALSALGFPILFFLMTYLRRKKEDPDGKDKSKKTISNVDRKTFSNIGTADQKTAQPWALSQEFLNDQSPSDHSKKKSEEK